MKKLRLILPLVLAAAFIISASPISSLSYAFAKKENLNSSAVPLAETGEIVSGAIYSLKNAASGKYLNVHNGVDAVGTNIYQWTKDNSKEQNSCGLQFNIRCIHTVSYV